jgi:hypothetical protein
MKIKNPTLLTLLKQGAEVKLPNDYILKGQPSTGYIEIGFDIGGGFVSEGLWTLDANGVQNALLDSKKFSEGIDR